MAREDFSWIKIIIALILGLVMIGGFLYIYFNYFYNSIAREQIIDNGVKSSSSTIQFRSSVNSSSINSSTSSNQSFNSISSQSQPAVELNYDNKTKSETFQSKPLLDDNKNGRGGLDFAEAYKI